MLQLCALLFAAAPTVANAGGDTPTVNPFAQFSGVLLADGFDGPQLDKGLWSQPKWLLQNNPPVGAKVEDGHLVISGPSQPRDKNHQYAGVISKYFRETDVVLVAEMQARSPYTSEGRIQHMVHLCSGDYPDFFTEIIFGKLAAVEPPRWYSAWVWKIWDYKGFREYLDPSRGATGSEATKWHTVVLTHDGPTEKTQNYLVVNDKWAPIGPPHTVRFNHTHIELKVDVNAKDVPMYMAVDNVRLYPNPVRAPVTIVVSGGVDGNHPRWPIHNQRVQIVEDGTSRVLGEAVSDAGGEARVTLKSDVIYPVAATVFVWDGKTPVVQSRITRDGVKGLYPGDVWALDLRHKRSSKS